MTEEDNLENYDRDIIYIYIYIPFYFLVPDLFLSHKKSLHKCL